jgi:alkylated DNA repair dioxygenase AlkB
MNIFSTTDSAAGSILAPVSLFESTVDKSTVAAWAESAWNNFPWEDRGAPRRECFFSDKGESYTYGSGAGARTYWPKIAPDMMAALTKAAEEACGCKFELCFANGYAGPREHLGWHADDSDEIDDNRPIAVMSLGAAREIWVKPRGTGADAVEKILLPSGSLFIMKSGMQDTHFHRIPKHDRECGYRVSLTWRGAA